MKTPQIVGLVLVVVGLISLLLGGISWTKDKTIVDIGPIEAHTTERKMLPIPPIVGGLALVGGAVLLVAGSKRRT